MASSSSSVGVEEARAMARLALAQEPELPTPHGNMFVSNNMLTSMGIPLKVDEKWRLLCIAYRPVTSSCTYGALGYKICVVLGQEDDPNKRGRCLVFCVKGLELVDGEQAIYRAALDVVENQLLQSCRDTEDAAVLYNDMVVLNEDEDAEQLAYKILASHKQGIHPHLVWTKPTALYLHAMEGLKNMTTDLGKQALDEAWTKFALVDKESYKKRAEIVGPMADKYLNLSMGDHPQFKGPAEENNDFNAEDFYWKPKGWASPPAVVPRSNGGPPLDEFRNPGDWADYQVNDGLSMSDIMSRKKAAQMRRL